MLVDLFWPRHRFPWLTVLATRKKKDEKRSRLLLSSSNWSAHSTRRSTHNLSVLLALLASVHVRVCNCAELCCRLPVTPVHHLACFEGSTEKSTMPHKQRGKTNSVIQQVLEVRLFFSLFSHFLPLLWQISKRRDSAGFFFFSSSSPYTMSTKQFKQLPNFSCLLWCLKKKYSFSQLLFLV